MAGAGCAQSTSCTDNVPRPTATEKIHCHTANSIPELSPLIYVAYQDNLLRKCLPKRPKPAISPRIRKAVSVLNNFPRHQWGNLSTSEVHSM